MDMLQYFFSQYIAQVALPYRVIVGAAVLIILLLFLHGLLYAFIRLLIGFGRWISMWTLGARISIARNTTTRSGLINVYNDKVRDYQGEGLRVRKNRLLSWLVALVCISLALLSVLSLLQPGSESLRFVSTWYLNMESVIHAWLYGV